MIPDPSNTPREELRKAMMNYHHIGERTEPERRSSDLIITHYETSFSFGLCEWIATIVAAIVAAFLFFGLNYALGSWQPAQSAVVLSRDHTPDSVSIGSGVGSSGKNTTVVTTAVYNPEIWSIVVRVDNKDESIELDSETWDACEQGKTIHVSSLRGFFTHEIESYKVVH